jgi:signal transduction histidine kinase
MLSQTENYTRDVEAIGAISSIPAILDVICRTTGMGFALVARVTDDRWIACAVLDHINFGLGIGGELKVETTLCHEVHRYGQPVVIDNVPEDLQYANHHTPEIYGLKSYIAVPITLSDGSFFGTLCAIDPNPAKIKNPETVGMFTLYAELIATHLDNYTQLELSRATLEEEKAMAELREQFIAILGHDLRNPVGAVRNVAQILQRGNPGDEQLRRFSKTLLNSSLRMSGLIDNLSDFTRGRLGGGIVLNQELISLKQPLLHAIEELQLVHPETQIETELNLELQVEADVKRVQQLFSNLLANALTHGTKGHPVKVVAKTNEETFTLRVSNHATGVSAEKVKHFFEPFYRSVEKSGHEGLGLGLYISSEIAKAHDGTLTADYEDNIVSFTFKLQIASE